MAIKKRIKRALRKVNVVKAVKGVRKAKRGAAISAANLRNRQFNARQKSIGSSKRKPLTNPRTLKKVVKK